jgi:hypothetical protein
MAACTKVDPELPNCWYGLGMVYLQKGDKAKAKGLVGKLKKLEPALAKELEKAIKQR